MSDYYSPGSGIDVNHYTHVEYTGGSYTGPIQYYYPTYPYYPATPVNPYPYWQPYWVYTYPTFNFSDPKIAELEKRVEELERKVNGKTKTKTVR